MTFVQGISYDAKHPLRITQNIIVPKPQDAIAVRFNDCRPWRIECLFMLPAIGLDHEFRAMTGEIDDELTDRHLPPETLLRKAFAQQAP